MGDPHRSVRGGDNGTIMNIKATSPGVSGRPSVRRSGLHWPGPDTLAWILLLVIAMVVASLIGLGLGAV